MPVKPEVVARVDFESDLWVKFRDALKVRASNGGVGSIVGANVAAIETVRASFGLTFAPSIQLPAATLDALEARAAQQSGAMQPDLAGTMIVTGPVSTLGDAADALLALDEVEWVQFAMRNPELPQAGCLDIAPVTPNYFADGLQTYHGPDPGLNMNCAWTYGGRGQGIRVADCESAYWDQHEDLCGINGPTNSCFLISSADHGTAVLGVMVSQDNAYGCTGLVPNAEGWFFSVLDPNTCVNTGASRATAIASASASLRPGDVILIEQQVEVGDSLYWGPAELEYPVWLATKQATDCGIVVVAAAGNGAIEDLDRDVGTLTLGEVGGTAARSSWVRERPTLCIRKPAEAQPGRA